MKSEILDHRLQLDLTVFHIDWNRIQFPAGDPPFVGSTTNGGQAESRGLEFSTVIAPLAALKLRFNAAYTEAELTHAVYGPPLYVLAGYQATNVPRWSLSFRADYDWQLDARWRARAGGDVRWVGQEWGTLPDVGSVASGAAVAFLPAYSILDLNASVTRGRRRRSAGRRRHTRR